MPRCELYQDAHGEWRWRQTAKNGDIEAYSNGGFETKEDAKKDGKENGSCTSYTRSNSY